MKIAVAREADGGEPRVAATPETGQEAKALGAEVAVEPAPACSRAFPTPTTRPPARRLSTDAVQDADIVLQGAPPAPNELAAYKQGALVVAIMDPYGNDAALKAAGECRASPPSPWS